MFRVSKRGRFLRIFFYSFQRLFTHSSHVEDDDFQKTTSEEEEEEEEEEGRGALRWVLFLFLFFSFSLSFFLLSFGGRDLFVKESKMSP